MSAHPIPHSPRPCPSPISAARSAAYWRSAVEFLPGPVLQGSSVPARAEHMAAHLQAQHDPSVWRIVGEALLIAVSADCSAGVTGGQPARGYLVQAIAGLAMLDAAMAREQVAS